jgi:lipopolysaccharide export system protein LptA
MRWQKRLRLAIGLFVVVFAAVVAVSLLKGHRPAASRVAAPPKVDDAVLTNRSEGTYEVHDPGKQGKVTFRIRFGNQLTYADGSSKFGGGVKIEMPDKNGRQIVIESQDARVTVPPGKQIGVAELTGAVKLTTSDGIVVTTSTATYSDDEQTTRIPGALEFKKGRMTGSGVGGTYDQARSVLWILDQAKVDVAPDQKGNGAIHVTSKTAGMARAEHYMKFTGSARLDGAGHLTVADEATAFLTEDDERVTKLELRGNSSMTGKPGASGPQDLRANDIDLAYAEDGRTLQSARLVENAVVQLPGDKGKTGRRIAGKVIDIALGPDGAVVTNLAANENVQVDLPPDGDTPARRIRSASLLATGAQGIESATFAGGVEYRESRAARGKLAAIERTAKSDRLDARTKPGFGDLETATFHNNVHFTDGTQTTADAPMAVYSIAQDRLELSPGAGAKGVGPHVSDGRISVDATNIQMGLSNKKMTADTKVRSVMIPEKGKAGRGAPGQPAKADAADAVKVPSLLKQTEPVNVRSNRLDYDGASSLATYEGNASLWQEDTTIKADKIVVDDKTGNLRATTSVTTSMTLTEPEVKAAPGKPAPAKPSPPKSGPSPLKPAAEPTITTADDFLYEDAKHRATYTGHAHMNGPNGDVTADKIQLFLAEQGGELERAEADGNVVTRQDTRRVYGSHLTYRAKDGLYTMTGTPVKLYDQTPTNCRITEGTTLIFDRSLNTSTATGNETAGQRTRTEPVCPSEGSY